MNPSTIVELARAIDHDFASRLEFLLEIDKLKTVLRRSYIVDGSRKENTAEHSWHLAMCVMILAPHAGDDVDPVRAIELLLVHDLVEIDAGDTYVYDTAALADKEQREQEAADRIFNLLPDDQARFIMDLWHEYEAAETATARFAYAVDRMQPMLLNAAAGGKSWQENGIRHSQATAINEPIKDGSSLFGQLVSAVLDEGANRGLLADDRIESGA
jgi:putative hydrolase of HD superfamily